MTVFLRFFWLYTPAFFKKKAVEQLFRATADAFGYRMPPADGLSYDDLLRRYAQFTRDQAHTAIQYGIEAATIRERLYRNAYELGQEIRKRFRITGIKDALKMGRLLYRTIKIDFHGNARGEIFINRCYFSEFYSGGVCRIISGLDEGLLAGLSAGSGRLEFSQRITEGCGCCKARFTF